MIDTEALRKKVIDLAIQGKLTEQLPSDGDAETLYAQILDHKSQLIKERKIKKDKELPEIAADEIPFVAPKNWKWVRAGSVLRVINGTSYNKGDVSDKGIRILRGGNIQDSKVFYFKDDVFISESYEDEEKKVKENDVLIVASTGSSTGIGKSGVVESTDDNTQIGAFLRIIRAHSPYISKYIDVYFMSDLYRNKIRDLAKGMNINNIKESYITEMLLPLPPLEEQKRIVKRLNDAFEYIGSIENLQAKYSNDLAVLKSKIIDAGIQGKLTEQLPEDGDAENLYAQILNKKGLSLSKVAKGEINTQAMSFSIPQTWKMVEFGEIFDFVDYRGKTPNKIEEGVFLVTASNIKKGFMDYTRKEYISSEEYQTRKSRGITKRGDILFTTEAPMGNAALCDLDECSCGQRVITFQPYHKEGLYPELFMYFILSTPFQKELLDNASGTTAKGIKADRLKKFLIPLPPYAEQERIANRINTILKKLNR